MPVVSASNLRITLGAKTVLDGATFAIEPGERVGLVGRNGCGKSTLLKILCGKLKPEGGEVSLLRGARLRAEMRAFCESCVEVTCSLRLAAEHRLDHACMMERW